MNNEVRRITEGAMMVAIIGAFLLIDRQVFGVMEYVFWIIPLPLTFYAAKYGFKQSILPLVAVIFLTFLYGTITSIFWFNSMSICGAVYGNGVKKQYSNQRLLMISICFMIFANLITTVLFAGFFGYDIVEETLFLEQSVQSMGIATDTLNISGANVFLQIYIVSTILLGVLSGFIFHIMALQFLKRLRIKVNNNGVIQRWIPPKYSGYVALVLWQLGVFLSSRPNVPELLITMSLVAVVLSSLYLLYFGYLEVMNLLVQKFGRGVATVSIVVLTVLIQYTFYFLAFVGFLSIVARRELRRIYR